MSDSLINPTWGDDGPEWEVAGYTTMNGEFHEYQGEDINYADIDLVTISWTDAEDGTAQYANLVGPFDDYDDLENVVETYFEEGTP